MTHKAHTVHTTDVAMHMMMCTHTDTCTTCAMNGVAVVLVVVWLPYILVTYRSVLASLISHIQGGGLYIGGGHCSITSSAVSGNTAVSMLSLHMCETIIVVCLCPETECSM